MGKEATITAQDAHHKAKAQSHLEEAKRILRHLSTERRRHRSGTPNLISEIKAILHRG